MWKLLISISRVNKRFSLTIKEKVYTISVRKLLLKFPELKAQFWKDSLWSPSYYVGTAGNVSAETIQKYIERTEHITKRR